MDNLIGRTLDGLYAVRELIGTGGMANVYKAVVVGENGPVPVGTVVAVKVLRQELMHDPDLVRRFKNESKAISLLNHPNIVKVYDVSVSDNAAIYRDGVCGRHDAAGVPERTRRQADQSGDGAFHLPDLKGAGPCPRATVWCTGTSSPRTSCCWTMASSG